MSRETVSIVRCESTVSDAEVVRRTEETIRALPDFGVALRGANSIAVKINAGIPRIVLTDGKQTELTDPAVVEGAIRAIRDVTHAPILLGDAPTDGDTADIYARMGYPERLRPYKDIRLLDFGRGEMVEAAMKHPNPMFRRYSLRRELVEADAFVSLAKMKAHTGMGCTLCIKNLFGWTPPGLYGAPRMYLHDRLIRLPRVLCDLAQHFRPVLNVVDGIVALNSSEWHGEPLKPGVIVAGTNIVATDAVGARIMGIDPAGDFPQYPFFYRRNATKLAAESGLGPIETNRIEVLGPAPENVTVPFRVQKYEGKTDREDQFRRGAACVAAYREQQDSLAEKYGGRCLALIDGDVVFDAPDIHGIMRWEHESRRDWQSAPQFVVNCRPTTDEVEDFDTYRREAAFFADSSVAAI